MITHNECLKKSTCNYGHRCFSHYRVPTKNK